MIAPGVHKPVDEPCSRQNFISVGLEGHAAECAHGGTWSKPPSHVPGLSNDVARLKLASLELRNSLEGLAAAMGPRAARRGAWGARTVRTTAAAVGPGAVRGAWGGHGLGEGGGYIYTYIYSLIYKGIIDKY